MKKYNNKINRNTIKKSNQPEIVAIYCPLWHNYDHASSWKGEGWCEWELLKKARPRFKGHNMPVTPSWGYFDESDPHWSEKEIDLASKYGIDVWLVDWYWYNGVKIMQEALENGLLRARNRKKVKFALMWANHEWWDYFPAPFDGTRNWLLPIRHSERDMQRVIEYCAENYFSKSHYWTVGREIFFSVFQPAFMVKSLGGPEKTRRIFEKLNRYLASCRLPPIHWNAQLYSPADSGLLKKAGFKSATNYNVAGIDRTPENLLIPYDSLIEQHEKHWNKMLKESSLPYAPVVTMGWDVTCRCEENIPWPFPPSPKTGRFDYPYCPIVNDNSPEKFRILCEKALRFVQDTKPSPYAIFVNAWNEWTEGSYLLPDRTHGTAYLKAMSKALK